MNASVLSAPKFRSGQKVEFIGGEGIIKNYRPQSGSWVYLLEMPMGLEPEMGRVGYETMIWLYEVDIYSPLNNCSQDKMLNHEQKMPFLEVPKARISDKNRNIFFNAEKSMKPKLETHKPCLIQYSLLLVE